MAPAYCTVEVITAVKSVMIPAHGELCLFEG
jgi:hypothetical protein